MEGIREQLKTGEVTEPITRVDKIIAKRHLAKGDNEALTALAQSIFDRAKPSPSTALKTKLALSLDTYRTCREAHLRKSFNRFKGAVKKERGHAKLLGKRGTTLDKTVKRSMKQTLRTAFHTLRVNTQFKALTEEQELTEAYGVQNGSLLKDLEEQRGANTALREQIASLLKRLT